MRDAERQKHIIEFARSQNGRITRHEAVEVLWNTYTKYAGQHVSYILLLMVKNNVLIRVSHGVYQLGTGTDTKKPTVGNGSQIGMF
jgi:hypothetical protein